MLRSILHRVEDGLLALILATMTLLTFVQVVLRYGFNSGFIWALEANFYLFAWLVLLGLAHGVRTRSHIGVDTAVSLFPPRVRRVIGFLVLLLVLLYAAIMLYGSWAYIERLRIIDIEAEDIPVKRWILSLCMPIGFAMLGYRLAQMGWRIVIGKSEGYELADEAGDLIDENANTPPEERAAR